MNYSRCSIFIRIINYCKNKWLSKNDQPQKQTDAIANIIPQQTHRLPTNLISLNALNVLKRLNRHHYDAFLVGGCIRDILLGCKTPKDFDIVTNARPEQVKNCFRNCRIIGRRFRLAHIIFGREIIEVATFRGSHSKENSVHAKQAESGMILRDNVYGTIQEDAIRRDFTINALYYNAQDCTIRDYCGGLTDLQKGIIRLIGDPKTRYREDPVRMLRALRFSAKLNMTIEPKTAAPIAQLRQLLSDIPAARLYDELLKLLQTGDGYKTYQLLREHQLIDVLFPPLKPYLTAKQDSHVELMINNVLKNTDERIAIGKRVNPAFLYAAFFWYPLIERAEQLTQESGLSYHDAFSLAAHDILSAQIRVIAMPKRVTSVIKDIWFLQLRLSKRNTKQVQTILQHPKFRAAYDLLELRAEIEEKYQPLFTWWKTYINADQTQQQQLLKDVYVKRPRRPYSRPQTKSKS